MIDNITRDNAFSAVLGEDYRLLKFAYPHHDEFQAAVAEQVHRQFATNEKDPIRVLEGGAGSGVTTSFLLTNQKVAVTAVDSAQAMLEQATELLESSKDRVELVNSDLLEYVRQQPDQSFHAFVSVWTLHNLQPKYRTELFGQVYRVLKNGGLFVSGDKYTVKDLSQHQQLLEAQLNRFKQYPTSNKDIVTAWVDHNLEDEQIRISESEQHEALINVGFKQVQTVYRQDMEAIITGIK